MSKVRVFILVVVTIVIFGLGMFVFRNINTNNDMDVSGDLNGDISGEVINEANGEFIVNWLHNEEFMKEFTLTSNETKATIGAEIITFEKESISQKEDRSDGFHWIDYTYDDIEVTAMFDGEDVKQYIHAMETKSSNYETTRKIKVGDTLETLKAAYPEDLNQNEWNTEETEYVYYSPEKYGFNRIFFFLKDDVITRIRIENGIDG